MSRSKRERRNDAAATTVLSKALYRKIKNVCFIFLSFMQHMCDKCYKPITAQYCIAHCVSWVPRLTLMDIMDKSELRTHSQTGTHSYAGDLLYSERRSIQCTNKVNMGIVSGSFRQVDEFQNEMSALIAIT